MSSLANGGEHDKRVGIIGIPFSKGQPKNGADLGPSAIRAQKLVRTITNLGWTVDDRGDIDFSSLPAQETERVGKLKNTRTVGAGNKLIHDAVLKMAMENDFALMLGGDHSVAIGTISAIAKVRGNPDDFCVIWVDAHADINTVASTPSGNIHGMPVSFLMGLCDDVPGFEWVTKCLTPDRIAYVGLRDVDEGEQRILKEYGITAYSMTDVDRLGIHTVMEEAMRKINPTGKRFVHLSFDVDGIDPSHTPSTGTAVQGGLNYREARYICEYCHQTGLLKSMDIVEVNPLIGSESEVAVTAKTSVDLAAFALGRKLLK